MSERLTANLAALDGVDPALGQRLRLPVEGSHVVLDDPRGPRYRSHQSEYALALSDAAAAEALRSAGASPLVFGIGLGELVLAALDGRASVSAWERDPWLLRIFLMRHDVRAALASGRLKLVLGADLVLLERERFSGVAEHPLLAKLYARELAFFQLGRARRGVAAVCEGGLFVDAVGRALGNAGLAPYTLDVERLALEELAYALARLAPSLVFSINYRDGLAEFCNQRKLPLVVWEIDPCLSFLAPLAEPCPEAYIFTYRAAHVARFESAGFEHVAYLPLGADPEMRCPVELTTEEQGSYQVDVAFVGSSLQREGEAYAARWLELAGARPELPGGDGRALMAEAVERFSAALDPSAAFEAFFVRSAGDLREQARARGSEDPLQLVGEVVAARRRALSLERIAAVGLEAHVWGDAGWSRVGGVRYRGLAGHTYQLNRIYSGAAVQVDLSRAYQADIVTMRVLDVLACGGFVLAEASAALAELFEVGREIEVHHGPADLGARVRYFLERPSETAEIAKRGREAVLERHSIAGRVERMLRSIDGWDRGSVKL